MLTSLPIRSQVRRPGGAGGGGAAHGRSGQAGPLPSLCCGTARRRAQPAPGAGTAELLAQPRCSQSRCSQTSSSRPRGSKASGSQSSSARSLVALSVTALRLAASRLAAPSLATLGLTAPRLAALVVLSLAPVVLVSVCTCWLEGPCGPPESWFLLD